LAACGSNILFRHAALASCIVAAINQPTLGAVADQWGLPAAYVALAAGVSLLMVILFAKSRQYCP
jgi:hypothetical protein